MQTTSKNRIQKEIQDFIEKEKKNDDPGIKILIVDNDITHWKGYIIGPVIYILYIINQEDTPYQGGLY